VASTFAVQLFGYAMVLSFIAVTGQTLHVAGLPLVALALVGMALLASGLALLLGAVHVFVRDLEQGLAHVLALLFYLSPILYSATMVPAWVRDLMLLNPIAVLIEAARAGLLEGRMLPGWPEGLALLFAAAVYVLGRAVFKRLSPHFEEAL
jgi:lipopolysaccharide transport system permease protein